MALLFLFLFGLILLFLGFFVKKCLEKIICCLLGDILNGLLFLLKNLYNLLTLEIMSY
jgi:hypothetical protein